VSIAEPSIHEIINRRVRALAREGKKPTRIAAELRLQNFDINAAQVRLILENTEDDQQPAPPAAALDAVAIAHENQNAIRQLVDDAMEVAKRKAEEEGKDALGVRIAMGAARLSMQDYINNAIAGTCKAGALYKLLGGQADDLPKALEVRVHVVRREDPVTTPTPEPV